MSWRDFGDRFVRISTMPCLKESSDMAVERTFSTTDSSSCSINTIIILIVQVATA